MGEKIFGLILLGIGLFFLYNGFFDLSRLNFFPTIIGGILSFVGYSFLKK
jgi:preprotein translocase subunit SecF